MGNIYLIRFNVTGNFEFPIDMLRYDACYPHQQVDVSAIDQVKRYHKMVTVTLEHTDVDKNWKPTTDRWASFGWRVEKTMVTI